VVPVRAMVTLWHSWVLEQGFVDWNLFYNDIFFDVKRKCRYRTSSRLENPVVEFNLSQRDRSSYWDHNLRWGTSLGAPWHHYLSAYLDYSTHESLLAGLHPQAIRFNKQDYITTEKRSNPCNSVPPLLGEGTMKKYSSRHCLSIAFSLRNGNPSRHENFYESTPFVTVFAVHCPSFKSQLGYQGAPVCKFPSQISRLHLEIWQERF